MKLGSGKAWARTLGSGLAHVQDGFDHLAEYGFEMLKKAGSPPRKDRTKNRYVRQAKSVVRSSVGFLGQLGDSYYERYEELKAKDR